MSIKKHYSFIVLFILLSLFSCSQEEVPVREEFSQTTWKQITINACVDEGTKTSYDNEGQFSWIKGDVIGLIARNIDNNTYRQVPFYAVESGAQTPFSGLLAENEELTGIAFYPYATDDSKSNVLSYSVTDGTVSLSNSFLQTDDVLSKIPLIGHSSSEGVYHFKTAVGILKFTVNNLPEFTGGVRLSVPDDSTPICGTFALNSDYLLTMDSAVTGNRTIENYTVPSKEGDTGVYYYFCAPGMLDNGFSLTVFDTDGKDIHSFNASIPFEIVRNTIINITPVTVPDSATKKGTAFTSFSLKDTSSGVTGSTLGITDNVVTVCFPDNTDLTDLVVEYEIDGTKLVCNDAEVVSGTSSYDFSQPLKMTIESRLGTSVEYTVKVYSFNLPTVYIVTPGNVPIKSKTDWTKDATFSIWNPDNTVDDIGGTSIKGRGNSTWWLYPKKPYALKLDAKTSILGMPKDKRWNLLANFADRTKLRNAIGFALAQQTDALGWTPHGEYVELILNGSHQGLYWICEKIKISKDRVNIKEMKSTDIDEKSITGGYILEMDTQYDEVNKFRTPILDLPVMISEPDESVLAPEQFAYISNYVNHLESLLCSGDISSSGYQSYLDIDSMIDVWFVKELVYNTEMKLPRSVYFHKDRGGVLKAGPVWDFDLDGFIHHNFFLHKDKFLYNYLFQDPAFVTRVKEKWEESKDRFQAVILTVDSLCEKIRKSEARDSEYWPLNRTDYSFIPADGDMTFDEAVASMKTNLQARFDWMCTAIPAL